MNFGTLAAGRLVDGPGIAACGSLPTALTSAAVKPTLDYDSPHRPKEPRPVGPLYRFGVWVVRVCIIVVITATVVLTIYTVCQVMFR
jgi:hypothetical protein